MTCVPESAQIEKLNVSNHPPSPACMVKTCIFFPHSTSTLTSSMNSAQDANKYDSDEFEGVDQHIQNLGFDKSDR